MLLIFFSAFVLHSFFPLTTCECDLKTFEDSIVPAIVPKVPQKELQVIYAGKPITCSQNIAINQVKEAPELKYDASEDDLHTLVMIDPDAPEPKDPKYAHFLHWLVVNSPGNKVEKGETIKTYMAPSPPSYSSAHRYIFLVFRQSERFNDATYMRNKGRPLFSIDDMKKKLKLTDLVAGNFFYTKSSTVAK